MNRSPYAQQVTPASTSSQQHAARLSNVLFSWKKDQPAVLDIPFLEIGQSERLFVGGASGSGKTTLLGLISGMLVPQRGSVELLGTPIQGIGSGQRDQFRADHIGYIHQMFNLIPYLSVIENITLPCRFSKRRLERVRNTSGSPGAEALRLLEHLGMGDPELVNRPVTDLSVGQQQRVAAARALIGAPEMVLADEPTSALDATNRETFIELLFRECAETKATLIFVSHDAALGPMFDRVLQLEGGVAC